MRPEVSVIVPAKDAAPYLPWALRSLTEQGVGPLDLEVIVVDDGSADATGEVARHFVPDLPGLRVVRNERARGPSASRNRGLALAKGETIAFLDADDWFGKGLLRQLLDARQRLGTDIVRCDVVTVSGWQREVKRAPVAERNTRLTTRDHIADGVKGTMVDFPNPFSGVYSRRLLDEGVLTFDESLPSAEDRHWNWLILLGAYTFAVADSPCAFYRRSLSTSLSAVYDERQLGFIDSCLSVYRHLLEHDEPEPFRVKIVHNLFALYDFHLRRTDEIDPALRAERERRVIAAGREVDPATLARVVATFGADRAANLAGVTRAIDAGKG